MYKRKPKWNLSLTNNFNINTRVGRLWIIYTHQSLGSKLAIICNKKPNQNKIKFVLFNVSSVRRSSGKTDAKVRPQMLKRPILNSSDQCKLALRPSLPWLDRATGLWSRTHCWYRLDLDQTTETPSLKIETCFIREERNSQTEESGPDSERDSWKEECLWRLDTGDRREADREVTTAAGQGSVW